MVIILHIRADVFIYCDANDAIMSDKWDILLPEEIHEAGVESIADFAEFTSVSEYGKSDADLSPHIDNFDAVILRGAELSERVIQKGTNLKIISKHGAGLDNVDISAASDRDIVVCNTPGMNSRAVAEHAITLMMAIRRNLVLADRNVRDGKWNETRTDWDRFRRSEIQGDVLGLYAFGNIAREVVTMATGLGMECVAYDPYVSDDVLGQNVTRVDDKKELFERSDIVSIHSPLTDETRHSIGLPEYRALGPNGIVVNTSRGGVLDEEALITALDQELILGAGLDVLEEEPPDSDNPLLEHEKVILTPHSGGLSEEATYGMSVGAAENIRTVYEGGIPDSTVNKDALAKKNS